MKLRVVVGSVEQHVVEVVYSQSLRLLRVRLDGRSVYRHCRLVPWAARRGVEIKTAGPDVHTLLVQPPGGRTLSGTDAGSYVVWLDGQPALCIDGSGEIGEQSRFTGERPGRGAHFAYDEARHTAAYRFARVFVSRRRVLDAGCGDGYGTASLAGIANLVVGVDASPAAIAGCRMRWREPDLRFEIGDVSQPGLGSERFDVVLAFQLIEHLREPAVLLEALARRLAPGGMLLLTTPNRLTSTVENPYHVHEYTAAELRELLGLHFKQVSLTGLHGSARVLEFEARRAAAVRRILRLDPLRLRRLLPVRVERAAFARLATVVRGRVAADRPEVTAIRVEDFFENPDDLDEAIDLVAVCRLARG